MKRLTLQEVMRLTPLEVSKLSRSDLANVTRTIVDVANKRIKRLEGDSPALSSLKDKGIYKFTTKGKNQGQLQSEFAKAKQFLNLKTSTSTGFKAYKKQLSQRLGVDQSSLDADFWKAYRNIEKANKGIPFDSTSALRLLAKEYTEGESLSNAIEKVTRNIENEYESNFPEDEDFFELPDELDEFEDIY